MTMDNPYHPRTRRIHRRQPLRAGAPADPRGTREAPGARHARRRRVRGRAAVVGAPARDWCRRPRRPAAFGVVHAARFSAPTAAMINGPRCMLSSSTMSAPAATTAR